MQSFSPDLARSAISGTEKLKPKHTKTRTDRQTDWNRKPESSLPKRSYREYTYATARDSSYPKSSA